MKAVLNSDTTASLPEREIIHSLKLAKAANRGITII